VTPPPAEPSAAGPALLRQVLTAVRGTIATALVAGLAWQAVAVATPYVVARAIDDGILAGDRAALLLWAGVLLALGPVRWLGDRYRHRWVDRSGMRAAVALRARLPARVADLDADAAGRLGAGELLAAPHAKDGTSSSRTRSSPARWRSSRC
jgi:ABC-type transport system involved in cytochrome bd biosynthesis fused ATPase/permease subunit